MIKYIYIYITYFRALHGVYTCAKFDVPILNGLRFPPKITSHCETHRFNKWDSTDVLNQMLFFLNPLMLLDLHFFLLPMEENSKTSQHQKELSGRFNIQLPNQKCYQKLENITKTSVPLDAIKHSVSFIRV